MSAVRADITLTSNSRSPEMLRALCPVCGNHVAVSFFDGSRATLATLAWPVSKQAAQSLPLLHLDFVQCAECTHVWNRAFDYESVPYTHNPNRMFNKGEHWAHYLADVREQLSILLPPDPVVAEIGCGEGHFSRALAASQTGKFIGFDPNDCAETSKGFEFYPRKFVPFEDMPRFRPDAIIIRHMLEHILDPAAFLDELKWAASNNDKDCYLYVCYVDDLIEGFVRVMDTNDEFTGPINLGNDSEISMLALADQVIKLIGSNSKIIHTPLPSDDPSRRRPDISLAEQTLNWKPATSLVKGLTSTIKYFSGLADLRRCATELQQMQKAIMPLEKLAANSVEIRP